MPAAVGGCLAVGIALVSAMAAAQVPPAPPRPTLPPPSQPAAPAAASEALAPPGVPSGVPAAPPPGAAAPAAPAASAKTPDDAPLLPVEAASARGTVPDPDRDAKALVKQGSERPVVDPERVKPTSEVFAEEWWTHARPVVELHGYFRVRSDLFNNFALGHVEDSPLLWPQPADNNYTTVLFNGNPGGTHAVQLCGSNPTSPQLCQNSNQASANLRLRLNPEIHISDNLRVMAQIDLLDNIVLGSTAGGYYNLPGANTMGPGGTASGGIKGSNTGYTAQAGGGYSALGAFSTTQWAPVAGVNSTQNSITVKRVWGEYQTPLGLLRFGRMGDPWGLGILHNEGASHESDYQTDVDRIMFVTGYKKYDLYVAGMWDFANDGATSATFAQQQGQPYNLSMADDLNQWGVMLFRKKNADLQRLDLAKGGLVVNGGIYFQYKNQLLASDPSTTNPSTNTGIGQSPLSYNQTLNRRNFSEYVPDLWIQVLYDKFRFEAEGVLVQGYMDNTATGAGSPTATQATGTPTLSNSNYQVGGTSNGWHIQQMGIATQSEYRAIEERLRVQFGFGWASGDPNNPSLIQTNLQRDPRISNTFSQFAFHPDYRIDLILFKNILQQVTAAYYFRPSAEYDFLRSKDGQKLGGGVAAIWSRASDFIQTPGHASDLGIELNGKIYFQSRDGSLNDNFNKMGGFYTSLEYGVLFPLSGLGYLQYQQTHYANNPSGGQLGTATAQTVHWYLGVLF